MPVLTVLTGLVWPQIGLPLAGLYLHSVGDRPSFDGSVRNLLFRSLQLGLAQATGTQSSASESARHSFWGCFGVPPGYFFRYFTRIGAALFFDRCIERFAYSCFPSGSAFSLRLLLSVSWTVWLVGELDGRSAGRAGYLGVCWLVRPGKLIQTIYKV